MNTHRFEWMLVLTLACVMSANALAEEKPKIVPEPGTVVTLERADGYQGIWYSNQKSDDEYRYKYSGGLGTYCAKHNPHAIYAPEVDKTFFVYGGTKGLGEPRPLLMMVSYYDHKTGTVPKPAILMEKNTGDAHHNPVLAIDDKGYLWVFASAHGGKDGFIWKSAKPYSIDAFEFIAQREFTYPQPRFYDGHGFLFLFTKYTGGRELYFNFSPDGRTWGEDRKIAGFAGHYQITCNHGDTLASAFNWHPPKTGVNARTNLYYMQTKDFGQTWTTASGKPLEIPLSAVQNDALVHDYQADGWLIYMKDITFDKQGHPVILYIRSKGYESGPKFGERIWTTARWTGREWAIREAMRSDHNYDVGSLYIEPDGLWRIIAPTEPGPQAWCAGGEMVMWTSHDEGKTWKRLRQLTVGSLRNHTYARRPLDAHPGFYAFWADGDALQPSESSLYFTDKEGMTVWRLPETMTNETEKPVALN